MSATPYAIQDDNDDKDSSLNFLQGQLNEPDDNDSPQGRRMERDSQMSKTIVNTYNNNNRTKQKKIGHDLTYDGIYLYKPGVQLPSLSIFSNQTIKIIIASEYIKQQNPELLHRNIYGTDTYTSNSDAVCILVHSGIININTFQSKRYEGVELTCKVIKSKKTYNGVFKNGILSRTMRGYVGNSLKPQSVRNLTNLGQMDLLERYASNMHIPIGRTRVRSKPRNIVCMNPIPQTHLVFNMNNEPAFKYSILNIADQGYQKSQFITKKLDQRVLYLETTDNQKFELAKKTELQAFEVYRLSRVKLPEKTDNQYFLREFCPLADDAIQVLYSKLEWDQIKWGNSTVQIKGGQFYIKDILSFKFHPKNQPRK